MNKFPIVGVGALVVYENRVLLVKRTKPPFKELWTIPGGKVRWGESLQQAAERELLEETGIQVKAGEVIYAFDIIQTDEHNGPLSNRTHYSEFHYVVIDLVAEYISGEAVAGDDAAQVQWISVDDILNRSRKDIQETTLNLIQRCYQDFVNK